MYSKKQHLQDNIAAIKTALDLKNTDRVPTAADLTILQKYAGFGGLKCVLYPTDSVNSWSNDKPLYSLVCELHQVLRDNTSSQGEYANFVQSLKSSVLTSFYTPEWADGSP